MQKEVEGDKEREICGKEMERDIERRKKREGSGCWPRRRRKGEEKKGKREEEGEKE